MVRPDPEAFGGCFCEGAVAWDNVNGTVRPVAELCDRLRFLQEIVNGSSHRPATSGQTLVSFKLASPHSPTRPVDTLKFLSHFSPGSTVATGSSGFTSISMGPPCGRCWGPPNIEESASTGAASRVERRPEVTSSATGL